MPIVKKTIDGIDVFEISGDSLEAIKANLIGRAPPGHCWECRLPFTAQNVFTPAGWRETAISGMCEACWDKMFKEEPEENANASKE